MLFIKKEIAGTPTLVPLTGDVAADPEGVICYVADQDKLSDPVDITSCIGSASWEAPYDGILNMSGETTAGGGYVDIRVNGCEVALQQTGSSSSHWLTATAHVNKGDTIITSVYCICNKRMFAQWYCCKDYDHDGSPWLSPYIANVGGGGGGNIGCQWCSTATYACITNSNNVSLAKLTENSVALGCDAAITCGIDIKSTNAEVCVNPQSGGTYIGSNSVICCDVNTAIGSYLEIGSGVTDSVIIGQSTSVTSGCTLDGVTLIGDLGELGVDYPETVGSGDAVIGVYNCNPFHYCASNGYTYSGSKLMTGRMLACPAELPASNCSLVLFYDYNGHCCLPSFYDENGNQRFLQAPDNSCYDTLGCVYTSNYAINTGAFNVPFGSTVPAGIYRADVWLTGCVGDHAILNCIYTACNVTPTISNGNSIEHSSGSTAVWESYPGVFTVGSGGTTNIRINATSYDTKACVRIMLTKIGG